MTYFKKIKESSLIDLMKKLKQISKKIISILIKQKQLLLDPNSALNIISLFKHDEKNGCVKYEKVYCDFNKEINIDLSCLKITQKDLLRNKSEEIIELYSIFKNSLLNEFDDLDLKYLVDAVSIKAQNEYLCIVNVKNSIKIQYYTNELKDRKNKTRDISKITTGGPLADYELTLTSDNINYSIELIKQVYNQKVKQ